MSNNGMKSGSNLEKVLKAGHFAFTGECGPPKGANVEHLKEKFEHLRGMVDAVNVTDNQTAVVRMSSAAASAIMVANGIEPNFQMVCRDRNRLAMMADVLGVYSLGVRNMLCLSGDHQKFGNHPQSKNVYDIDSMQLIAMVKKMRDEGKIPQRRGY
jgi:methylenetetrahydrofolate reductase (NADPH)